MLLHTTFITVAAVYLIMATGYGARRIGWIRPEADSTLLALVVNLLSPCLIASKVLQNDVFADLRNLYVPPLLGFGVITGGILVGYLAARCLPKRLTSLDTPARMGTFAACVGVLNYGYVPIPLLAGLYPNNDRILAVLFVFNLGAELALWTVCVMMILGRFDRAALRSTLSVPTVALLSCLAMNVTGSDRLVPEIVMISLTLIGTATIPMSLLYVGGTLADRFGRNRKCRKPTTTKKQTIETVKIGAFSILLRLIVLPILILLLARAMPVSREIKIVLAVYAAMASAVFPIVITKMRGGDVDLALKTVLINTVAALVTTPLWLVFGLEWLDV